MKITANEEYGLRIILRLAKLLCASPKQLVSLQEIASAEAISVENTAAILSKLREGRVVESLRGKYGGYKLAREAEQINLYQIMSALSQDTFNSSFCETHSGHNETCVHTSDCSVRPVWYNLTNLINNFFAGISLYDLMQEEASAGDTVTGSFKVLQNMTENNLKMELV